MDRLAAAIGRVGTERARPEDSEKEAGAGLMPESVGTTIDMVLDLGLDTIIGALFLAALTAAVTTGMYLLLRRGKPDVSGLLVSLILVANLACLVMGAGFIQTRSARTHDRSRGDDQAFARAAARRRAIRADSAWRQISARRSHGNDLFLGHQDAPAPPDL